MDTKTIFVLTAKGQDEVSHNTSLLYGDIKRALSMMDGVSTFAEISKRAAPSLRSILAELVRELVTGGFIEDKARAGFVAKIVVPPKMTAPTPAKQEQGGGSELDFTTIMRAPSAEILRAEAAKIQVEQKAKQEAEAEKLKLEQGAKLKQDAEEARRVKEQQAKLQVEQEAKAKAEAKIRELAEQSRLKAEQVAKIKSEVEAKAKQEAEAVRSKAEQDALKIKQAVEQQAKAVAEAARLKAEQEARQRAEAELKSKKEAEASRLKVEQEAKLAKEEAEKRAKEQAEFARLKAEQEAEKARKEAELVKQKAEAEAQAREAAERSAKEQAEAARIKAEQDAARVRAELEAARLKSEAEAKTHAEAEAKLKQEAEAARLKAEQAAIQAKEEAERVKREAEAQAKAAEEAARKAKQEAEAARIKAEQEAARVREELEAAKLKVEQENKARLEAEAARLAAEKAASQARMLADQLSAQERENAQKTLEQQAIMEREEEQKRAKQHALAAASTQVRDTPYDTSKPPESAPAIKLDAFDMEALTVKPVQPELPAKPAVSAPSGGQSQAAVSQKAEVAALTAAELKAKEQALKEHAKQAEAARIAEEAAAKKLADVQAKAWSEAEQRAVEAAKAHASHLTQQAAQTAEAKKQMDIKSRAATKVKRKTVPWGAIVIGLLVLALLSVFIVPMALPTQEYAAKLEKKLAEKLRQPVHVGKLSLRILPTPRIDLGELYIGEVKQIKAQQAQLSFGFGALFGEIKRIDTLELQGAELNGSGLLDVPVWLQQLSADTQYPITRIVFKGGKLNGEAVQISDLEGEVNFNSAGKFSNTVLRASGGKMVLDIKATSEGKLETTFNLHGSALPLLPHWNFDDMTAKGELTRDAFVVEDFDGRIAGGVLQGEARLDWKSGWSAQGSLNAKTVSLVNLNKLLEGDLDGVAHFKMQADTLAKLTDTSALEGSFVAKKGVINGVDIVEAVRLRSKENLPGGRTHFDQLDSVLNYNNGAYHFKSMKIVNSVLSSNGNIDIVKQQLSGRLSAHLSITEGMGTVDLQVGGATDNPILRAAR
jgi:hypothetical protein